MKALVKEQPGIGISYLDIQEPEISKADDVLFKVEYCAISLDDVKAFMWNDWVAKDPTYHLPAVLGREVTGTVLEVGSAVESFKPGDRITVDPIIPCGQCYHCQSGRINLCVEKEFFGKRSGGLTERVALPERAIRRLPDKVSLQEGTLLDDLGTAVHAIEMAEHHPGDCAVIIGTIPMTILATQALAAWGVKVVLTDVIEGRLDIARDRCPATIVNMRADEPRRVVAELTGGRGADFVLLSMATEMALGEAFSVVRDGGMIVSLAPFNRPIEVDIVGNIMRRELTLKGATGRTTETWNKMIELVEADKIAFKSIVTTVVPMSNYHYGFDLMRTGAVLKVLLQPKHRRRATKHT